MLSLPVTSTGRTVGSLDAYLSLLRSNYGWGVCRNHLVFAISGDCACLGLIFRYVREKLFDNILLSLACFSGTSRVHWLYSMDLPQSNSRLLIVRKGPIRTWKQAYEILQEPARSSKDSKRIQHGDQLVRSRHNGVMDTVAPQYPFSLAQVQTSSNQDLITRSARQRPSQQQPLEPFQRLDQPNHNTRKEVDKNRTNREFKSTLQQCKHHPRISPHLPSLYYLCQVKNSEPNCQVVRGVNL
ncbi:hypothetical protein CLU79DRAFT_888400 [Phycomyces nitens]|nr:hypothetical protein CLU79DRAFT_838814 [Phycomyces nitens]KAI9020283.1 hypothetical protein CLU79DRAFT_888400 [Phycomyces nitens]